MMFINYWCCRQKGMKMVELSTPKLSDLKYFLLALFPILSLYEFLPLLDIGNFILMAIIIIIMIKQNLVIRINFEILCTMLILIILNLIVGAIKYPNFTNTMNNTGGMIVFTILASFLCCPGFLDKEKLYKACRFVGLVATAFLFYQAFAYNILDMIIMGNIPFLTYIESGFQSIEYGRPTSFFYEPAHYCIYVAPIYAMAIIKKEYWLAIILFAGVVFSTSTTGIILLLVIPIIVNIKKAKSLLFVSIFTLIGLILFIYLPELFNQYINKLSLSNLMENIRILGTLSLFQYFSMPEWIFGVGINRLAEFLYMSGESYGRNYANSIIFLVFSFGIFGSLFWINLCVIMFRKISSSYRIMWYILMFVMVSDQILFNRNLLYLLIWVYVVSKESEIMLSQSSSAISTVVK